MGLQIDYERALRILEEELEASKRHPGSTEWVARVNALVIACDGRSLTMIAMLGTALLAKASDLRINPFALQKSLPEQGSYSARGLVTNVLAANAPRLNIDLGVTGREPLNNQPFFGKKKVASNLPVKDNARSAFNLLLNHLDAISSFSTESQAREALRAFVYARRKSQPQYEIGEERGDQLDIPELIELIERFVETDSEYGKRAQAIAAGLMDVQATEERVQVGKIHDPDRRFPGDVGVQAASDPEIFERSLEVRDKPVTESDLYHAVNKAAENEVTKVAILAISRSQSNLNSTDVVEWAWERGVLLVVYTGWHDFVEQTLFWSPVRSRKSVGKAYRAIFRRIVQLEVSESGLMQWIEVLDG